MDYIIMVDTDSEIPYSWEDEYELAVLKMPYTVNDVEYEYDLGRNTDIIEFYDKMRKGAKVTTAQRNPLDFIEMWKPMLEDGKDILYIGFSSQLSGTFHCSELAREEILPSYPGRKILLVDTLTISMPLGLLIKKAVELKAAGKSIEETAEWVDSNKQRAQAIFTVDDLAYLKRGGRVTGAQAFFGTLLEVKPVLHVSTEGKLVPLNKVKGRKKALKFLVDALETRGKDLENELVAIIHADCINDAETLKAQIESRMKVKEILITPVGPVIGSHAGPGTIAVCFMGENREFSV